VPEGRGHATKHGRTFSSSTIASMLEGLVDDLRRTYLPCWRLDERVSTGVNPYRRSSAMFLIVTWMSLSSAPV
jgi:hypothetical protein